MIHINSLTKASFPENWSAAAYTTSRRRTPKKWVRAKFHGLPTKDDLRRTYLKQNKKVILLVQKEKAFYRIVPEVSAIDKPRPQGKVLSLKFD